MYPLTKSQKLVYDMEKYAGGAISVICGSMLLKGEKDTATLQMAVNELYRINSALRIRIIETDSGTMQTVEDYTLQDVAVLRFPNKLDLDTYVETYAQKPLELYGQLCEINVVLLPGEYGLLVKLHHIISDAWTLALVGSQYNALLEGEMPTAYSYFEHIAREENYLQSNRYAKDRTFFLEQFRKCEEVRYLSEKQSTSFISKQNVT